MSQYTGFPVSATLEVKDTTDIRLAADRMADVYEKGTDDFAFRILLPRGENMTSKAKKLGMTFQGEFVLTLRKRNLVPVVRDVRYIHDDGHYGWILASPKAFDRFEGKAAT